ncbi:MAG: hypothetical protein GY942_00505, partial [Aestuariibacter sp.]|nr:hypothetical protein [Aestuariibacter sp.]
FDGAADPDTINLTGNHAGYQGQYNSNVGGFEQLAYTAGGNSYAVNYRQTETVTDNLIAAGLTINGSSADDSISLGGGQFTVNNATTVLYSGKTDLAIDGQAGNDLVTGMTASTIAAGVLVLSNINTVGNAANAIATRVNRIELVNISGDVYIDEVDAIEIGQLDNFSAQLTLANLSGDITSGSALISGSNLQLQAQNGNILLDNNNLLGGQLALSASGNISLNNLLDT